MSLSLFINNPLLRLIVRHFHFSGPLHFFLFELNNSFLGIVSSFLVSFVFGAIRVEFDALPGVPINYIAI